MDSKTDTENEELSRYLWSLDNALNGLINLCNNKPEISDRIIKQVDNKLNVWNQHILSVQQEKKESNQTLEEDKKTSPIKKPSIITWGDLSDEESSDNDRYLFPKPTGLCKPQSPKITNNNNIITDITDKNDTKEDEKQEEK
eukprot:183900_1